MRLHYHYFHYNTLRYIHNYTALHYTTLNYTTLCHTTVQNATVHETTLHWIHHATATTATAATLIAQHYNYNSATLRNYNCIAPHYIQQVWWGDHCNQRSHSKKNNSSHLSVHQWIRPVISDSQQRTSPKGFPFWNFRRRLVRYYWYMRYSQNKHRLFLVRKGAVVLRERAEPGKAMGPPRKKNNDNL